MATVHPYAVKIEGDPLNALRFRWTVCEGAQIHMRSPHSYATRAEARADADKALSKLAANQPRRADWTT